MHATTESDSAEPVATTVAIDLAKDVLEVAFADASGRIVGDLWRGTRQCRSPDGAAQRRESGIAVGRARRLVTGGAARSSPGLRCASSGLRVRNQLWRWPSARAATRPPWRWPTRWPEDSGRLNTTTPASTPNTSAGANLASPDPLAIAFYCSTASPFQFP